MYESKTPLCVTIHEKQALKYDLAAHIFHIG